MNAHKKQSGQEVVVWATNQQLLKTHLERMVKRNTLAKLSAVAAEAGMGENEFHNKISINPRTPLEPSERIAIEHFMASRDPEAYQSYLREFHMTDSIVVEEVDQWIR